jgi:hypothetical protein
MLNRVLEEVEKVMNEFKSMLFMSMEVPNIDITNVSYQSLKFASHFGRELLELCCIFACWDQL